MIKNNAKSGRLDFLGSVISIACAIHCFALPILVSAGALVTLNRYDHELAELMILIPSMIICAWSVTSSYRRHKKVLPSVLFALSLCIIAVGTWSHVELTEIVLNTSGAFLIAAAHLFNRRFVKRAA